MKIGKLQLILIDKDFNVKQAIGSYKTFHAFSGQGFNFNILKLVPADLAVALGVAVRKAIDENNKSVMKHVVLHTNENIRIVNIIVKPYLHQNEFQQPFISIVIEEEQTEAKTMHCFN